MSFKQVMREEHVAYRRRLRARPQLKADLDEAIISHIVEYFTQAKLSHSYGNAAAYFPLLSEPGGARFTTALHAHCRTLFLPISLSHGLLRWAPLNTSVAPRKSSAFNILEPRGPRFNSNVLHSCEVVVVPAMAVDTRGMRLGKGAGYYDRALASLAVPTVAVIYEHEFVDSVPYDEHDIPVAAVITEQGVRELGGNLRG